jgi:hypothetical protein
MVTVGAAWHHRYRYYNPDGDLTDPDAIVAWVKTPAGLVTSTPVTVTQDTTGVWDVEVTVDAGGVWFLKVAATGTGIVDRVDEATICAQWSSVA